MRVVLRSAREGSNVQNSMYNNRDDLVFGVLSSQRPQDLCDFQTLVRLDQNLACYGRECLLDTMRVVEVVPGVFYEVNRQT